MTKDSFAAIRASGSRMVRREHSFILTRGAAKVNTDTAAIPGASKPKGKSSPKRRA